MPWRVYDQVNKLGGFVPALEIHHDRSNAQW